MTEICKRFDDNMKKVVANLTKEYAMMRVGRANPAVLAKVVVDYYGTPTPLQQLAAISVSEARILVVQPWDKSALKEIERAIQTAEIGINPANDGNVIRIVFPPLTEDRRKEISKAAHKEAEEAKIAIRNVRRDGMEAIKGLKKENEITEDDVKLHEKEMQGLTDKYCKEIDVMCEEKEREVMEM
ncbi:MAG: ribosome recycling factor [Oscillospiraceae bacterium]|jgi:ribosome recycling factor|nr:ribosome recycling factor [Oscillospiraceae bacterium]